MSRMRVVIVEFEGEDVSGVLEVLRHAVQGVVVQSCSTPQSQTEAPLQPPCAHEPKAQEEAPDPDPSPKNDGQVLPAVPATSAPDPSTKEKELSLAEKYPCLKNVDRAKVYDYLVLYPRARITDIAKEVYGVAVHNNSVKVSQHISVMQQQGLVRKVAMGQYEVCR